MSFARAKGHQQIVKLLQQYIQCLNYSTSLYSTSSNTVAQFYTTYTKGFKVVQNLKERTIYLTLQLIFISLLYYIPVLLNCLFPPFYSFLNVQRTVLLLMFVCIQIVLYHFINIIIMCLLYVYKLKSGTQMPSLESWGWWVKRSLYGTPTLPMPQTIM